MAAQRVLPLLISLATLLMTYVVGRQLFHARIGAAAALLLGCQNIFLAQATFQLPEMLLGLCLLLTLWSLFSKRWIWFAISSTALIFTKESGFALLGVIFLFHFLVLERNTPLATRIKRMLIYLVPALAISAFFLNQYFVQGWFLFPEHTGYVTFEWSHASKQFKRYFMYLFIMYGRNAMFFGALALGIFALIRDRKRLQWTDKEKNALLLGLLLVGFLVFSAVNFYSNRYLLCVFPILGLLGAFALDRALQNTSWLHVPAISALVMVGFFFSFTKLHDADHSMGYSNTVRSQQSVVNYCLEQSWQQQPIVATYLIRMNLDNHYPGYINPEQRFQSLFVEPTEDCTIFIRTSNERDQFNMEWVEQYDLQLIKRFEVGQSWSEIYATPDSGLL